MAEPLLLLDTGDALVADGGIESQTMGEDIVAGMNLMAYDAMAIGPLDLELAAATLRQRLREAEFPMLSVNVLWSGQQGYVGEPYTIIEAGSCRVGVIGLTRLPDGELADYRVLEPEKALTELLPEVAERVDTVVLLTNLTYRSAMELVDAVPGIDLVIAALPRQLPDRAARTPQTGTLIVTAEQPLPRHTGRRVGRLEVMFQRDGTFSNETWESVALGPEFADDPGMKDLLEEYHE